MDATRRKNPRKQKKKKTKTQMASGSSSSSIASEDQLSCPICLDTFVHPTMTPCGHSFCRSCLSAFWDRNPITCPVCREQFPQKPDLKVNIPMSELVHQFHSLHFSPESLAKPVNIVTCSCHDSGQHKLHTKPDVFCDICTELQSQAVKSCVECMASYCELHLEPHQRVPGLKRHKLIQPQVNFGKQICQDHNRDLSLFCTWDRELVCNVCASLHDAHHEIVSLQKAYEDIKDTMDDQETEVHEFLQDKIQKAAFLRNSIQQEKDITKNVIANSVQALNEVVSKLQKTHAELVKTLEDEQETSTKQMEALFNQIQEIIARNKESEAKIKQLKEIKDPLAFLQTYSTSGLGPVGHFVSVSNKASQKRRRSVKISLQTLMDRINNEMAMVPDYFVNVQNHQVNMWMNSETAHPRLAFSFDDDEVWYNSETEVEPVPPSPERFTSHFFVLSGSCIMEKGYFEVFVGDKSEWILGVAKQSVQRKGKIPQRRGCGIWALCFRLNRFETFCCPGKTVCSGKVETVGVYANCKADKVSFYDVKTATLLYSFTNCNLPNPLYAILNPCDNELGNNSGRMKFVEIEENPLY